MATIDEVKRANRIEDVIGETQKLQRAGAELRGADHDSLRVNVDEQMYYWFSKQGQTGWSGDVITWVQYHVLNGVGHGEAIRWLCERAGLPFAVSEAEQRAYAESKAKAEVLEIVTRLYAERLSKSERAKAYAAWRGWGDSTIVAARLGFTGGEKPKAERDALISELKRAGCDVESPLAVAVLGFVGDVAGWCERHGVQAQVDWLSKGRIGGIPDGHLAYPHVEGGRVVYISTRLADRENKGHYNLHSALAGEKRVYVNWLLRGNVDYAAVVEGQADAVTLGQWGMPALALAGVGAREAWQTRMENVRRRYAALDGDETGQRKNKELAAALGPRTTFVVWPHKDANGCLMEPPSQPSPAQAGEGEGSDVDWRNAEAVRKWLNHQPTYVEWLAAQAGQSLNGTRDDALLELASVAAKLEWDFWEINKHALAEAASVKVSVLGQLVKRKQEIASDEEAEQAEVVPDDLPVIITRGMELVHEHFIDLVWRAEFNKFMLAVRFPDGTLAVVNEIELKGARYVPMEPSALMGLTDTVIFPNGLNAERKPLGLVELHKRIVDYAHKYFDAPAEWESVAGYYIILTWLYDCFPNIGYLRMLGPYGVGKSRFVDTYGYIAYRAIRAAGSSSVSPVFRTLHLLRGTLCMDEINAPDKSTDPELEMIFKLGSSKRSPAILRTTSGRDNELFPEGYLVYGGKIFGAIKKFNDPATDSRCITLKASLATVRKDIPVALQSRFDEEAEELRKELMTFRMAFWEPEKVLDYAAVDEALEPRSKQIAAALFTIVKEPETRAAITRMLLEQESENRAEREMSIAAKLLQAVLGQLSSAPAGSTLGLPYWDTRLTVLLNKLRELVFDDEDAAPALNSDGTLNAASPRNDKGHWVNRMSPKKVSTVLKAELGFRVERCAWHAQKAYGVQVVDADLERLQALCRKYGVEYKAPNMGAPAEQAGPPEIPSLEDEYLMPVDD